MSDDATGFADDGVMESISVYLYPLMRLSIAGVAVWLSAAGSKWVKICVCVFVRFLRYEVASVTNKSRCLLFLNDKYFVIYLYWFLTYHTFVIVRCSLSSTSKLWQRYTVLLRDSKWSPFGIPYLCVPWASICSSWVGSCSCGVMGSITHGIVGRHVVGSFAADSLSRPLLWS